MIEFIPKKIKFNLKSLNSSNLKRHLKHNKEIIVAKMREDSSRNEQALIRNSNLIPLPPSIVNVSKSICLIFTQFSSGSGFLLKLFKGGQNFFCLVTNEHVINENLIQQGARIEFKYDDKKKYCKIYLNTYERFIRHFRDFGLDATVVEILPEDNINQEYFLLPNLEYVNHYNNLIYKYITIIQYPNGVSSYAMGQIVEINRYEFTHLASTEPGSSGSPIFLKDTTTVGIHKSESINYPINFGDFIGPIILYFKNYLPIIIKPKNLFSHGDNIFNKKAKLKINLNPGFYQRNGDGNKVFKIQPGMNNFDTQN